MWNVKTGSYNSIQGNSQMMSGRNPLHRKNQAPKGTWSLAKSVITVSWFIIFSEQLNYNTVVDLFQVPFEKGE